MRKLCALMILILLALLVGYLGSSVVKADEPKHVYHLTVENKEGDVMYMSCVAMPVRPPMKDGVSYR